MERATDKMPWYDGPCFFELLDSLELPTRYRDLIRIPVLDRMKSDMGVNFYGKIESGVVNRLQEVTIYPIGAKCQITDLYAIYDNEDQRLSYANPGENIRFRMNTDNKHIHRGYVICTVENPVPIVKTFEANMQILDLLEHKPIMSAGYRCIMHVHTAMEEVVIEKVISEVDLATRKTKKVSFGKVGGYYIVHITVRQGVCMELYKTLPYMGRFTLRDEGRTIGIGKVTKIIEGKEPEEASSEEEEEEKEGEEAAGNEEK